MDMRLGTLASSRPVTLFGEMNMRVSWMALPLVAVWVGTGCSRSDSCTVKRNPDSGVATLVCPDGTSYELSPGAQGPAGQDGTSCTVTRDAEAAVTRITCADGTQATVADGTAGSPGAAGPPGPAGDAGASSTVQVDPEPPGTNCPNGGVAVSSGGQVSYVCNGTESRLLSVNAGVDRVVSVGSTVTLAGTAVGSALGVRWNQVLGPPVSLADPHAATTTFTAPNFLGATDRTLVFQLLATDGARVESDLVVLTLNHPPTTPELSVTPAKPQDTDDITCSLLVPAYDEDGDPLSVTWSWTKNGQPFTGATSSQDTSTVPASETTSWDRFSCEVTVSDGLVSLTAMRRPSIFPPAGTSCTPGSPGQWSTLWDTGDGVLPVGGYHNNLQVTGTFSFSQFVFEDLVVPEGEAWCVGALWSNNETNCTEPLGAAWEVRQDLVAGEASSGAGGTVVTSGSVATAQVTVNQSLDQGFLGIQEEKTFRVETGGVLLTPGTYWTSVSVVAPGQLCQSLPTDTKSTTPRVGQSGADNAIVYSEGLDLGPPYGTTPVYFRSTGAPNYSMGAAGIRVP